jgi:hypothetical protein
MAQLDTASFDASRRLNRDVLIQNIAEKRAAKDAFTNLIGELSARKFQNQLQSNQATLAGQGMHDEFTRLGQQYNTSLAEKEKSTQVGAVLGGVGTVSSLLGGYAAEDFQSKALEEALKAKEEETDKLLAFAREAQLAQEKALKQIQGTI